MQHVRRRLRLRPCAAASAAPSPATPPPMGTLRSWRGRGRGRGPRSGQQPTPAAAAWTAAPPAAVQAAAGRAGPWTVAGRVALQAAAGRVGCCPPRGPLPPSLPLQLLKVLVGGGVAGDGAAEAAAQGLNLDLRRTRCIFRLLCFHLRPGRCQLRCSQPGRPRRCCSGLSRRSPALLCRGELGVSLAPCARGDRALRRCVGHGAPPRGCCVERGKGTGKERQPVLLLLLLLRKLLGVARLLGKERNKRYPVYRKVRP